MLFRNEIICKEEQNYIYRILFKDYYNHFYNLGIILLSSNNFEDGIINFVFMLYVDLWNGCG